MNAYAGIGGLSTPVDIQHIMTRIAERLGYRGHTLPSGGASGADNAFEQGAIQSSGKMEIFLPYPGFEGRNPDQRRYFLIDKGNEIFMPALDLAFHYHPLGERMPLNVTPYMVRNCFQVLGVDLKSPVDRVICWTRDGAISAEETSPYTGGTGQAIRIAHDQGITISNLQRPDHLEKWLAWLSP
ncbi:hypothetical protein [Magnetococcus sp. PR-3]|uniref:hypothetical protein n=1 Tax=Magnetococcus sp. PR-3 TaxID=3120355 RepID=UPI002FCE03B0